MKVVLSPAARVDALDAFGWYEGERPGLGGEFRDALDATFDRIAATPNAYRVVHRDLRRALVRRFPYQVFFRVQNETLSSSRFCTHVVGAALCGADRTAKERAWPTERCS